MKRFFLVLLGAVVLGLLVPSPVSAYQPAVRLPKSMMISTRVVFLRPVVSDRESAQAKIDQGKVVAMGDPCGDWFWLAGHRTTHGGPMRHLPELRVGDGVVVFSPTASCTYRITDVRTQIGNALPNPFPQLLMQTSWPGGFWLVSGVKV